MTELKALITAGGRGTRLRPITHTTNKHLVEIANEPLLFQAIANVAEIGVKHVVININADDQELPEIVGDGERWGVKIDYIRQEQPLGLGHVIKLAEPLIGDASFVFYYGDNVLAGGLRKHHDAFVQNQANCHLCLVKVEQPEHYGVAVVEGEEVIRTVEKPSEFVSDLAITGVQFYDKSIFEAIRHVKPTPPKPPRTIAEMDIPPANQWLIDNGYKVTYSEITGWWKDTGRPDDLIAASRLLLGQLDSSVHPDAEVRDCRIEGSVRIEPGAKVVDSVLVGPVLIGAGAIVERCELGPDVTVGRRASLTESTVANSIVMDDAQLQQMHTVENSILGHGVSLRGEADQKRRYRFIIGDNSSGDFS